MEQKWKIVPKDGRQMRDINIYALSCRKWNNFLTRRSNIDKFTSVKYSNLCVFIESSIPPVTGDVSLAKAPFFVLKKRAWFQKSRDAMRIYVQRGDVISSVDRPTKKNGKSEKDQDAFWSTIVVNNRNALLGSLCPRVKWTISTPISMARHLVEMALSLFLLWFHLSLSLFHSRQRERPRVVA